MEDRNTHSKEIWSAQRVIEVLKEVISTGNVIKKNFGSLKQLSTYYISILTDYIEDSYTLQNLTSDTVVAKSYVIKDFKISLANQELQNA
jgi:hypothetical protein